MATAEIVTVTPHRLRFLVDPNDEAGTVEFTAQQLADAGLNPFKQIVLRSVDSDAAAQRLLLGIGQPGNVFVPNSGDAYCRVRIQRLGISGIDAYCSATAIYDPGLNKAIFQINVYGTNCTFIVDLEVEHTLTR